VRNAVVFVLIGLAGGFAVLHLLPSGAPNAPLGEPAWPSADPPAVPALVESRLPATAPVAGDARAELPPLPTAVPDDPIDEAATPSSPGDRIAGLVAAGFTTARAAAILQRAADLRRAAYAAEYESTGTIRPLGAAARAAGTDRLRTELGDDDFERYLAGTGQPRSVVVRAVDADSAAAHAGLIPGDEIRMYAGQRVFNQRDLNALMLAGTPGEVVATTVVRDGQTLQLYVTRGPLGLM
jgi:hypothetical protein